MLGTPSPSPLLHPEDFGALPIQEEGPSQIGTHRPLSAEEPLSGSSNARGEFHIATSYMHLTLVYAAWVWGEPAPSPSNSKQKDQPSAIGEVESMSELVC